MAGDAGEDEAEDERSLELETVAAIFPELHRYNVSACIDVAVEPVEPLLIRFTSADGAPPSELSPPDSTEEGRLVKNVTQKGADPESQDAHQISHLPPLTLHISLPDGYPSTQPPMFYLESQHSWLPESKLQHLRKTGHVIWEDMGRDQVVFAYIDYLREAVGKGFSVAQNGENVLNVSSHLKVALLDFDLKAKRARFEQETFECGICLEPKKGSVCHRIVSCSHVFCVECLQDYFNSLITEGDIGNVKCMTPKCGSVHKKLQEVNAASEIVQDSTLEPSELLQIPLEQETVQRYVRLKRKKRLESDKSTVYCPRQWCQGPARCPNKPKIENAGAPVQDSGEQEPQTYDRNANPDALPPPAERLAICEDCSFAFCKVCKASWHGEYFTCFPRSKFELTAEEKASEDYMMLHTQPCPTCEARAQKTHGCNHMICFKCNTHFCYLCGGYLDEGNPYQHYNTKHSCCYMRLWELEGGDDGEIGQDFGGAGWVPLGDEFDDEGDGPDEDPVPLFNRLPAAPAPPAPPQIAAAENLRRQPAVRAPAERQNIRAGLQRALRMIQNDEEDEWDSDEMDDEDDDLDEFGAL
ncbi:translation termination inhibitor protein itt1 [Puttea exsequens]|nr:translation termination inhibitor protein itt1 [Puttea exsequens]